MGLDLVIMPLRNRRKLDEKTVLCTESLRFDRDYSVFAQIADINGRSTVPEKGIKPTVRTHPLPPNLFVELYEEDGTKKTRENPYGEEMVYSFAEEMSRINLPKDRTLSRNNAIMAYIRALPKDTPIILEWR